MMNSKEALEYVSNAGADLINKGGEMALARLEADARALWAVRVLDAWEAKTRQSPFRTQPDTRVSPPSRGWYCSAPCEAGYAFCRYGNTPDDARFLAATALVAAHPELDPDAPRGGS